MCALGHEAQKEIKSEKGNGRKKTQEGGGGEVEMVSSYKHLQHLTLHTGV